MNQNEYDDGFAGYLDDFGCVVAAGLFMIGLAVLVGFWVML